MASLWCNIEKGWDTSARERHSLGKGDVRVVYILMSIRKRKDMS